MKFINLNRDWKLKWEDLHADVCRFDEGEWLNTVLPCDIHMPLIEKGIIKEPLAFDNAFACEWTENKSWWFYKEFVISEEDKSFERAELHMEGLDCEADMYLNNEWIGRHKSAFFPFVSDIKERLNEGKNTLLVRISSGLEHYDDYNPKNLKECVGIENFHNRGDRRRIFARKPQYVYGWDWNPRVPSCAIESVYLEFYNGIAFRNMAVYTKSIGENSVIGIEAEIQNFDIYGSTDAILNVAIYDGNRCVKSFAEDLLVKSGTQIYDREMVLENAKLWWPNGMGEQNLYHVKAYLDCKGERIAFKEFDFGIRSVAVCTDRINEKEREFAFVVNGIKIFCKGANWIPADSIYTRISPQKIQALVGEAREANFNMLRVWGGGLYEREVFYEACDRNGILVWQDFMFACAMYPDFDEEFLSLVEKEIDYQTKRLRRHASLALFCGSNENHEGAANCWRDAYFGGARIYNDVAPRIVHNNCRYIPYWNSSPYGGDNPMSDDVGDKHHWHECIMSEDVDKRVSPEEYDKVTAKFVSEYGYLGPCCKSSIKKYYGDQPFDVTDSVWQMHTHTLEKGVVLDGISMNYADIEPNNIDDYLLYGGLCQGNMYWYSLQSFRIKQYCSGGLFWMFHDCWGENGWSVVDYYLNRKPAYYFVKRAFEDKMIAIRCKDGEFIVYGVNDTNCDAEFHLEFGYMTFDGKNKKIQNKKVCIRAFTRNELVRFKDDGYDLHNGIVYAKSDDAQIRFATFRAMPYRQLNLGCAHLKILDVTEDEFKVRSDMYAHAVHFNFPDEVHLSDEYFDLLPHQTYTVKIHTKIGKSFDLHTITGACVNNREK